MSARRFAPSAAAAASRRRVASPRGCRKAPRTWRAADISSVRTVSGKLRAFSSARPESSVSPAGISSLKVCCSGSTGPKRHHRDGLAGFLVDQRRVRLAGRIDETDLRGVGAAHRRGEGKRRRLDGNALRVLVHARAAERRSKRRPHLVGERLLGRSSPRRSSPRCPCPIRASLRLPAAACARRPASPAASPARRAVAGISRRRCRPGAGGKGNPRVVPSRASRNSTRR